MPVITVELITKYPGKSERSDFNAQSKGMLDNMCRCGIGHVLYTGIKYQRVFCVYTLFNKTFATEPGTKLGFFGSTNPFFRCRCKLSEILQRLTQY